MSGKTRPTHFLCIPFGVHHPSLCSRVTEFLAPLKSASQDKPAPKGIDPTIFIAPIRLHLTLGVMRLIEQPPSTRNGMQHAPLPTVAQAVELLRSCHEEVQQALDGKPLQVSFNDIDSFQRHKQACHVLYGVPSDPEGSQGRLKRVCDVIYHRFRNAGYIFDNARDYTLHLTLVNSSHRKPTQRGAKLPKKRIPFDASALFEDSEGSADLGTYVAPECFVSRMGSRDEQGAYVTFGGIPLLPRQELESSCEA